MYDEILEDGMLAWRPETYSVLANLPRCKRCGQTELHSNHRERILVTDRGTCFFGLFSCNVERMIRNTKYHAFERGILRDMRCKDCNVSGKKIGTFPGGQGEVIGTCDRCRKENVPLVQQK